MTLAKDSATARYQDKAEAVRGAWAKLFSATPNTHATALAMSVAELETQMGDTWPGEHNWGFVHARPLNDAEHEILAARGISAGTGINITKGALAAAKAALPAQPNLALHIDTGPGDPYFIWTPTFPNDESGAERFLTVLLKPNVLSIIGAAAPVELARAMYANRYFQGNSSDPETNVQAYGGSIARQLAKIEPALAPNPPAPAPQRRTGALAFLLLALGGAAYAWFRK